LFRLEEPLEAVDVVVLLKPPSVNILPLLVVVVVQWLARLAISPPLLPADAIVWLLPSLPLMEWCINDWLMPMETPLLVDIKS